MPSLVVFGATGFLGRTLIAEGRFRLPVKAITRSVPSIADRPRDGVTWIEADLLNPRSIDSVIETGDVVLNLAYMAKAGETDNRRAIDNLIESCLRAKTGRLVHCSTAAVVGASNAAHVDETTPCEPMTAYEKTKWTLEDRVRDATASGLDAAIVRPTAIVGPGGQNLRSLARSLREDSAIVSYLRACVFGTRQMHLVPVRDVAAAMLHVAELPGALAGDVFIVSSDDDPDNNFRTVEGVLTEALCIRRRALPAIPIPASALGLLLRIRGRSETRPSRRYGHAKLRAAGFRPVDTVAAAVREFGASLQGAS